MVLFKDKAPVKTASNRIIKKQKSLSEVPPLPLVLPESEPSRSSGSMTPPRKRTNDRPLTPGAPRRHVHRPSPMVLSEDDIFEETGRRLDFGGDESPIEAPEGPGEVDWEALSNPRPRRPKAAYRPPGPVRVQIDEGLSVQLN
jgi:hypothetical protein